MPHSSSINRIAEIGIFVTLTIVFLWFGGMKFTQYEAEAIEGLIANSPFISFSLSLFSAGTVSKLIGSVELLIALLLALRFMLPGLAVFGALGASATFALTSTFFLSTPGVFLNDLSGPAISVLPGQFLLKDIVLLFASIWALGNALQAIKK